jgi:DNA processing protein
MPVSEACLPCLRRGWLLRRLGARLDRRRRDPQLLWDLLALGDESLIEAIGGRRRRELHEEHRRFDGSTTATPSGGARAVCRHHGHYPACLAAGLSAADVPPAAPWPCLYALGAIDRAQDALGRGVAIVGTRRASDYGMHVAHTLAHDLAQAGVEVSVVFGEGVAFAALSGALQAGGAPLAMMAGCIDRCSPASCAAAFRRVGEEGCLLAQLPPGSPGRRWSSLLACRTILLASAMTIVVELERDAGELACVAEARSKGKPVGAVPGRLTSPGAGGTNDLLREGAVLVRDAHDALAALHGVSALDVSPDRSASRIGARSSPASPRGGAHSRRSGPRLRAHVQTMLQAVDAGRDTLAKLAESDMAYTETVLALAELELEGLLVRGDGGRYLPSLRAERLTAG